MKSREEACVDDSIRDMQTYFSRLAAIFSKVPMAELDAVVAHLVNAYEQDRTVFVLGNGGSAALASHMVCDLAKGATGKLRKRLRVHGLTDNIPCMTAWANDAHYEDIFAEQLIGNVKLGDIVLAISGSGNSKNVLKALAIAREAKGITLGLTGFEGGAMKSLCDICCIVPADLMEMIEDVHLCMAHAISTNLRYRLHHRCSAATTASK